MKQEIIIYHGSQQIVEVPNAMKLGALVEQVVLLSERSFEHIKFIDYEVADYREYCFK